MAVLKEIPWNEALQLGIKVMLGMNNAVDKLKERKEKLQQELELLEEQIIKEEAKKPEEQETEGVILEW